MILGTLLLNVGSTTLLTPWLPRGGDNAVFTYQVIKRLADTGSMAVGVYHKNREDAGAGVLVTTTWEPASPSPGTAVGYWRTTVTGLKEMVRFAIACDSGIGTVYRILEPTWFNTATP